MSAPAAGTAWPEAYLAHLALQRNLSPHTVAAYRRDLRQLAVCIGALEWPAVSHAEIRRQASKLHASGLSARSIARKLSAWRGFFDWLGGQTLLEANPAAGIRAPKRGKSLPKALSVDDAVRLVATPARPQAEPLPADLCNRAMFELLYSSGLRVSELVGLKLVELAPDVTVAEVVEKTGVKLDVSAVS